MNNINEFIDLMIPSYECFGTNLKSLPPLREKFVLSEPDRLKCHEIGKKRKEFHKNHLKAEGNPNSDIVGLCGECGFGRSRGLEPDWSIKYNDEYDFIINENYIDCKTSEEKNYFKIKKYRFHPKSNWIYQFSKVNINTGWGEMIGWITGLEVSKKVKLEYDRTYNQYCYRVPAYILHQMTEFDKYVGVYRV